MEVLEIVTLRELVLVSVTVIGALVVAVVRVPKFTVPGLTVTLACAGMPYKKSSMKKIATCEKFISEFLELRISIPHLDSVPDPKTAPARTMLFSRVRFLNSGPPTCAKNRCRSNDDSTGRWDGMRTGPELATRYRAGMAVWAEKQRDAYPGNSWNENNPEVPRAASDQPGDSRKLPRKSIAQEIAPC